LILPDYESSAQYKRDPGIYCPQNENHVGIRLFSKSVREKVWEKFYELQAKKLDNSLTDKKNK
jgi:hypothetical protein